MQRWFLIYTKPKQDARAEAHLQRQGFEVFRPTIAVDKSTIESGRRISFESMFPRYLFISADPKVQSIAPVTSTCGVHSFVRFGAHYATASDRLITQLSESADAVTKFVNEGHSLQPGDMVYVNGHGFDRIKAIYHASTGEERALILLDILGKESQVSVPIVSLTKRLA